MEKATFAAGCFWGIEEKFRKLSGVTDTAVGYMGGDLDQPNYHDVCTGRTGHAEVVQVRFDPTQLSYNEVLALFWRCHDPTQKDRQGLDFGTQYRSAIFFHSPAQETTARESLKEQEASGAHGRPIVTEIAAAQEFWRAEEYHQKYVQKQGGGACGI